MILAFGSFVKSPSQARLSGSFCSLVNFSGKFAIILATKEISLVSIVKPECFVNALTIGRKLAVARAGASSVLVHIIL